MSDEPTCCGLEVEQRLAAIGISEVCLVFIDGGRTDTLDAYGQELMAAALNGHPIIAAALRKPTEVIGKELLHALACIPTDQSTLTEEEMLRIMVAADAINELRVDLIDLLETEEEVLRMLDSFSRDGLLPVLGIDLRTPMDSPPFGPPNECVERVVRRARELRFPVLVALEASAHAAIWEKLYAK
jgi:hypothetical protein